MIEAALERARLLMAQQRYKDAEKELRKSLAEDPNNPETLSLLGICKSNDKKYEEAEALLKTAIGISPSNPYIIYIYAKILYEQNKLKPSENLIREAIQLEPYNADFFGLLSAVYLDLKEWQKALEYSNKGLEISADNLTCLNIRSTALIKLDKKEESYNTINDALNYDPNNAFTHTNLAWGLLEKGEHKMALHHFKKALQLDPESAYAKQGLVEALKARYFFYRIFLKYRFWISNMKSGSQWGIFIGLYIAFRVVNGIADSNPTLAPFLMPVVFLYILFAISTWIIVPITNLFLRLNVYGKYALTKKEIQTSNFVGIFFTIGLTAFLAHFFVPKEILFMTGIFGVTMMIPMASMLMPWNQRGQTILVAYSIALCIVGLSGLVNIFNQNYAPVETLTMLYLGGIFLYQWVANAVMTR